VSPFPFFSDFDGFLSAGFERFLCFLSSGYQEFFEQHLWPNLPLVIGPALTASWRARREWVTPAGTPNLAHLEESFGDAGVQAAVCRHVNTL